MIQYITVEDVPESLRDIVDAIGIESFKEIVKVVGGTSIYVPSLDCITRPARNRIIKKKFRGSYKELAVQFGMTETQIRNIIKQ